jgi:predicted lipoprotein with Yx(FWY)xxD motif
MNKLILSLIAAGLITTGCASMYPATTPASAKDGALVAASGMSLYVFDKDMADSGKSACNGKCAEIWPPFFAMDGDKPHGDFAVITRDDGKRQWSYKGKPLYFWSKDQKPGDRTGDGFNGLWKQAR